MPPWQQSGTPLDVVLFVLIPVSLGMAIVQKPIAAAEKFKMILDGFWYQLYRLRLPGLRRSVSHIAFSLLQSNDCSKSRILTC